MKIIISIRSLWACKILNGDKKIEVRKGLALYNALKKAEERGEDVEFLMYVTQAKPYLDYVEQYDDDSGYWYQGEYQLDYDKLKKLPKCKKGMTEDDPLFDDYTYNDTVLRTREARKDGLLYSEHYYNLNGKVVARFKAKAEVIKISINDDCPYWKADHMTFATMSLSQRELLEGACLGYYDLCSYTGVKNNEQDGKSVGTALHISNIDPFDKPKTLADYGLKRAPQSWCYAKEV